MGWWNTHGCSELPGKPYSLPLCPPQLTERLIAVIALRGEAERMKDEALKMEGWT